jgi:gas vesicle protein
MSRNLKYLGAALAGGVVGAIVGLLFAPAPGRETRRKLARKIAEEKEALLRRGHQTLSRINDVMGA